MAYASLSRQVLTSLMITTMLASCSIDGLVPPARIDGETRVSSIRPTSQAQSPNQSYQVSAASTSPGGYDDPYALNPSDQVQPAPVQTGNLPMIDSDEAMGLSAAPGVADTSIPQDGVNMDAQFGFAGSAAPGSNEGQYPMIAEGATLQPVVDGIGTDNPVQTSIGAPLAGGDGAEVMTIPPKRDGTGVQRAGMAAQPVWADQTPVVAPTRMAPQETQELAMLTRPEDPTERREPVQPRAVMPKSEVSCRAELRRIGVVFRDIPRISDGPSCGIEHPVLLSGFSGGISLKPATKLNCQTTLALARWVKNELAPSSRYRYLSGVKTIESMGGYSCRRMNNSRQKRNPMSEHARGNAIDLGKFVLKNGKRIDVRKKGFFAFRERGLLNSVRDDSCKYFHTVLGPGSNKEHWNHFHFDLRARKSGSRYCD